jgi:predicted secreted Zn-dependent protease
MLSTCINMFLVALFIAALPLPKGFIERIGLAPLFGTSSGAPSGQAWGNIAEGFAAIFTRDAGGENPGVPNPQASEAYNPEAGDIVYERYPVYGNTQEELQRAITDLITGVGPLDVEEGKRYAAYATADYTVDYRPRLVGYSISDGEVAVELGTVAEVQGTIHLCLPSFRTSDPELSCKCEAEEARLEKHEMEHVKVYRQCAATLEDSLTDLRVLGRGSNIWTALASARQELDETIAMRLNATVQTANSMNIAIDKLTSHGLGIG